MKPAKGPVGTLTSRPVFSKQVLSMAHDYATLEIVRGYPDTNAAITMAKAILRAEGKNR